MKLTKLDIPKSIEAGSLEASIKQAKRLAKSASNRRAFIVLWPDQSMTVEAVYPPTRTEDMRILAVSVDGKLHTLGAGNQKTIGAEFSEQLGMVRQRPGHESDG